MTSPFAASKCLVPQVKPLLQPRKFGDELHMTVRHSWSMCQNFDLVQIPLPPFFIYHCLFTPQSDNGSFFPVFFQFCYSARRRSTSSQYTPSCPLYPRSSNTAIVQLTILAPASFIALALASPIAIPAPSEGISFSVQTDLSPPAGYVVRYTMSSNS